MVEGLIYKEARYDVLIDIYEDGFNHQIVLRSIDFEAAVKAITNGGYDTIKLVDTRNPGFNVELTW